MAAATVGGSPPPANATAPPSARPPPLFNVSSNEVGWQAAIHTVVHRVGRHFGFQAFNPNPRLKSPTFIPATIFLVTDHLYQLMVKNFMRRDKASGSDEDRWVRAVFRLHAAIFHGYRDWCRHVDLPECIPQLTLEARSKQGPFVEWEYLLEELALYFLMYSEGANLRHTPEALWFLYWCLRNSYERQLQISTPPPTDPRCAATVARTPELSRDLMKQRIHLRSKYNSLITDLRREHGVRADGETRSVSELNVIHTAAKQAILEAGVFGEGSRREVNMVAEMVAYGDSGAFLDKLVSPIFLFLAVEVGKKGAAPNRVEVAARVTYDDVNESLCMPEVVHKTLQHLGVRLDKKTRELHVPSDLYGRLLLLRVDGVEIVIEGGANGTKLPTPPVGFDAKKARDWWAAHVFGKTYVERRSLLTMYRTFYRVWAFLILEFHFMAVMLWGWPATKRGSYYALCSVALDHAFLSLLEQVAGAWTQRSPAKGVKVLGRPFWGRFSHGIIDWLAINVVLYLALAAQLTGFFSFDIFYYVTMGYAGLVVFHAVVTTRDGYCVSLSNELGAKLRRWRRDPRACCGSAWTPVIWLLERVGASSARPVPHEYLAPYHMKTGWYNFFCNLVFWVLVLAAKFAFDWFALIKPLRKPVIALWNFNWLGTETSWGDADFILVVARCLPSFIVMFNDAQIFYYFGMAIVGSIKGILQLNLGSVSTFQEVVISFHKAPKRWWDACMSKKGKDNLERAIEGLVKGEGTVARRGGQYTMPGVHVNDATLGAMVPRRALNRNTLSYTERLLQGTQDMVRQSEADKVLALFEDSRIAHWVVFSDAWNAVVEELRSIDLVSNSERDNLLFVHLDLDTSIEILPGMRPFMLPVFFYGGQISKALETSSLNAAQRVALTEIRSLLTWLLLQLGVVSRAQADVLLAFTPLPRPATLDHRKARSDGVEEVGNLLKALQRLQVKAPDDDARDNRWAAAVDVRKNLVKLVTILRKEAEAVKKEHPKPPVSSADVNPSHKMYKQAADMLQVLNELEEGRLSEWKWQAFAGEEEALADLYHESPDTPAKRSLAKVVAQVAKMLSTSAKGAQPRGEEAQRVLSTFAASLKNPTLETPPSIEDMLSWNTLTPHYEEDVIYALNSKSVAKHFGMDEIAARDMQDLMHDNADGVNTMQWLRSAYPADWNNLLERLKPQLGGLDPRHVTDADFDVGGPLHHVLMDLQLWASYRGQLLARTVRGMMAYEKGLRLLAHLECPQPPGMSDVKYMTLVDDVCRSKFTYVLASQAYAKNRYSNTPKGRWLALGVDVLLHQYPSLRVAFIDTFKNQHGTTHYSVLIRGQVGTPASAPQATQELYRIRLPKNSESGQGVILGEGKPENQNASVIFCFGEVVQAIDMNQDNYLSEAFKMRNLINEFNPPIHDDYTAAAGAARASARRPANGHRQPLVVEGLGGRDPLVRVGDQHLERPWPDFGHKPVALVGFREWIFSGDSGALAGFAAATEFTFGSIVQRVMTWPGSVRFHYGHPDLWNKLFIMTRGGVSKATRAFHISEDVFAGYNAVQRSGAVKFKEYISVGKGRDMGFDSILVFEAKVSGGNGEQVMSRDVHRLCTQFDFFRLLAFYHSGCGFFINTALVMLSVYVNIWVLLLMGLSVNEGFMAPYPSAAVDNPTEISVITGQTTSVSVQQVVQLGMFSIITYAVELLLEQGFMKMAATLLVQIVQGSLGFFIFRSRTTAYYFTQDVQYGGAKYAATGRGYAIVHTSFVKVYTNYARSHLYYAAELLLLAILLVLVDSTSYAGLSWSTWMVAVSIFWAPFWFNPQTFQLERCKDDFEAWLLWMNDVTDTSTKTTWFSWNKSQLEKARNEDGAQLNPVANALRGILVAVPTALLAVASITSLNNTTYNRWLVFATLSGGFWGLMAVVWILRTMLLKRYMFRIWRLVRTFVVAAVIAGLVCVIIFVPGALSVGVGIKNLILIMLANFSGAAFLVQVLLFCFRRNLLARRIVDGAYRLLDWFLGYFLFAFLFLLSIIFVVDKLQGALLFNMKFAKALERSRLLEANYLTSYVDRASERSKKSLKEDLMKELAAQKKA